MSNIEQETKIGLEHIRKVYPEKKKKGSAVSFEELEREMEIFFENAYAQNYFAPNRVIPKSQRPKWRFMVKNFI